MNIVALFGSPRPRANSTILARRFLARAEERGARIKSYTLNQMKYRGCQACMGCKTHASSCVLKDDLTPVLAEVAACDLLLMATPVYYSDVSSQLKGFIDRTYGYLHSDYHLRESDFTRLTPGKKMVFFLTQGMSEEKDHADIFPRYDFFFRWLGFTDNHCLRGCGVFAPGEMEERPQLLQRAEALAEELVR